MRWTRDALPQRMLEVREQRAGGELGRDNSKEKPMSPSTQDTATFWRAMFSNHYVGWATPFLEGATRGLFWGNVVGLPFVVLALVLS